jgi:hypothetical protein
MYIKTKTPRLAMRGVGEKRFMKRMTYTKYMFGLVLILADKVLLSIREKLIINRII